MPLPQPIKLAVLMILSLTVSYSQQYTFNPITRELNRTSPANVHIPGSGIPSNPCPAAGQFFINSTTAYFCGTSGGNWIQLGSGAPSPGTPAYTATITAQTSTTVLASSHGQGSAPLAFCRDNSSPAVSKDCIYTVNGSGDVVFSWNPAFTGTIEIIGATGGFTNPMSGADQFIASLGSSSGVAGIGQLVACGDATHTCSYSTSTHLWTNVAISGGSGTVTTSGSPAIHQIAIFSGASAITGVSVCSTDKPLVGVSANDPVCSKLTLTNPATAATLTLADNKTFIVSNSLTLAGTDGVTYTGPSTSQTFPGMNQTNTGGSSLTWDMSASSSSAAFRLPNIAGASSTTAGAASYDTTNKMPHVGANSVDNLIALLPSSITPANNDCAKFTVVSSVVTLNTTGAACSGFAAPATLGTSYISQTFTAGTGGTTANLLMQSDASGNAVLATSGGIVNLLGIAVTGVSAAAPVEIAYTGEFTCVADGTITIDHIIVISSTTAGRCHDSAVTSSASIGGTTIVVGIALSTATVGNTFTVKLCHQCFGAALLNASFDASSGKITKYNGVNTVLQGVPFSVAIIDLTGQSAAIAAATALYTPVVTARHRITYWAKVTTAATTSSILGGTTGLALAFQDGTDSVAQAVTLPEFSQSGTNLSIGTGNTGNATTTVIYGEATIWAKTGVAITYGFGYTSVGGTAMQYELHINVELI